MADIYTAAQMTIVAAAGNNPSYGLPGVFPTLRKPLRHETVGTARLYALPRLSGLRDAFHGSVWATRAWTLQESFFSRRRLIFTDRQMLYVCDTSTRYEATTLLPRNDSDQEWLKGHTPRWEQSWVEKWPMERARRYLSTYSRRSLRFDADALKAISGALNTLITEGVYHIWGVPFSFKAFDTSPALRFTQNFPHGEIALIWIHRRCGNRRRHNIPSWSPLGWEGVIDFHGSVDVCKVFVQTESGQTSLPSLVLPSGVLPPDCSQQLTLELEVADVAVFRPPSHDIVNSSPLPIVALRFEDSLHVRLIVHFDINPDEISETNTLKAALVTPPNPNFFSKVLEQAHFLLLRKQGDVHDRIGVASLQINHMSSFVFDAKSLLKSTRDREAPKSNISKDIQDFDRWRVHFRVETIVLG